MKTIILIFLVTVYYLSSQNYEPAQFPFEFDGDNDYYLSHDSAYFKQNNFILGWAWSYGKKMSEAMLCNQAHVGENVSYQDIKSNTNLIICAGGIYDSGRNLTGSNSQSMCYSPVLRITNEGSVINNPKKYIFGFRHIDGETIGSNDTYLKLRTSGSYISSTIAVLDSAWADNYLYWYKPSGVGQSELEQFNTEQMYFVINLKRSDPSDNTLDDTPVLKIKLPYSIANSTGYIQFDSIPSGVKDDTFHIRSSFFEFRGAVQHSIDAGSNIREFFIRRNMLPLDTGNITISAHFICAGEPENNPKLSLSDSLGIQVFYLGNTDVNINHLYLATQNARKTYFGYYDKTITDAVQRNLDYYSTTDFTTRGIKIFRFNTRDEIGPAYFGAQRYINKLIGNVTTTQSQFPLPRLYEYYVDSPDQWTETHRNDPSTVPYFRNMVKDTTYNYLSLGNHSGYAYIHGTATVNENDTLNSGYETHFRYKKPLDDLRNMSDSLFRLEMIGSFCFQKFPELFSIDDVMNERKIPLFSDKYWWGESFIGSNFVILKNKVSTGRAVFPYNRPKTGEETRYNAFIDLILGAKGLLYDREQTTVAIKYRDQTPVDTTDYWFGIGYGQLFYGSPPLNTMDSYSFIHDDRVGSDFLNPNQDFEGFHKFITADSTADTMGVNINRIYIGRKSPRVELFKIHNWIRANDSVLMRLRLSCWYGKGVKTWYNQDTARFGQDTILKKFISLNPDSLFTKRIWNAETGSWQIQKESWDSSFFDITLLRDSSDHNLTSSTFYIGVQNRRTDPLVFWDYGGGRKEMRFLSTAEFEDSCRAVNRDTAKFQSYFWKRLGCRELRIPFKYRQNSNADNYTLLKITELGDGDSYLDTVWYRQPKYYHKIDTLLGRDSSLVVRLLPGEGKILKVQVLYSVDSTFKGSLAWSNQRKMVAYPDSQTSMTIVPDDTTKFRYHAVFFKPIPTDTNRLGVYYRRSYPMDKTLPQNQIDWEPFNHLLSDSVIVNNFFCINDTLKAYHCGYPSIVVRYDSLTNHIKAYVVYSCKQFVDNAPNNELHIVENIFRVDTFNLPLNIKYARTIAIAKCDEEKHIHQYGSPMINASYNGNFYCWSDSLAGIVAGWKQPNAYYFNSTPRQKDTLKWNTINH